MGFMTEVSILNDGWDQIEKDPVGFVQRIKEAMHQGRRDRTSRGLGNHANMLTLHPSHHADDKRIYLAYQNMFLNLNEYGIEDELSRHSGSTDARIDFYRDQVKRTIADLEDTVKYLDYLESEVPYEQRPGGKDYDLSCSSSHHMNAWRWKKGKRKVATN
jgi:hypothetical protein